MRRKSMNTVKTQDNFAAEIDRMNKAPINYSDIPPMTEEERKTSRLYYKEFLDKLPRDMVKELVQRRLAELKAQK